MEKIAREDKKGIVRISIIYKSKAKKIWLVNANDRTRAMLGGQPD